MGDGYGISARTTRRTCLACPRENYIGAYPSEGMSHPLIYQIAEEAAERLPRYCATPRLHLTLRDASSEHVIDLRQDTLSVNQSQSLMRHR